MNIDGHCNCCHQEEENINYLSKTCDLAKMSGQI